jgi:FixJ family two-component response regulator
MNQNAEMIYVVDDDSSVREGLTELLAVHERAVVSFGSAKEFLAYTRCDSAACLILDLQLPDISGLDLQRSLADRSSPPIIFISGHGDIPCTVQAMKGGAIEFLTKPVKLHALLAAIDAAFVRDRIARQRQSDLAALQGRLARLTRREREVLPLIISGFLNKQAAAELNIAEVTLQVHRGQIMRKMAARSFAELVRMAWALGIPVDLRSALGGRSPAPIPSLDRC